MRDGLGESSEGPEQVGRPAAPGRTPPRAKGGRMTKTPTRRRGPKTPAGKIAVRLNATTHGILSASPVVNEYERADDWEEHRRAVVDYLGPDNGMEQILAERVALCSWRLNRAAPHSSGRAPARPG